MAAFSLLSEKKLPAVPTVKGGEKTNNGELNMGEYVKMSVDSGVPPFELSYVPVLDCSSGQPLAYRSVTTIHSVLLGTLPEDVYTKASDKPTLAEEMLYHNLQHVARVVKKMQDAERHVAFVSVRCPDSLVDSGDVYTVVSRVLSKNPRVNPQFICLEFPASVMEKDLEKAAKTLLDVKVLRVKTAIAGCGKDDFPAVKLISLKPDYLYLDPAITAWAGNRNKPQVFTAFVSFVKSLEITVFAEASQDKRNALRVASCDGYVNLDEPALSEEAALAQKEDLW